MTDDLNDQRIQRLQKLETLRSMGVPPYGTRFEGTQPIARVVAAYGSTSQDELAHRRVTCRVAGRIVALRRFGKAAFASLQEGAHRLQVYFRKNTLGDDAFRLSQILDLGDWIGVDGSVFRTKTDELTVEVQTLTFLSKGLRPLPEKWHGLTDVEIRYRQRYVDLMTTPGVHRVFETRSRVIAGLRSYLTDRGFLEVETPMMHPIPGGAAARPFTTHHHALHADLYLRIAPELYLKRLIVGGFQRVFELNRNFRNEGLSTIHNPEFTMLEFYQAYADYHDLMALTEDAFLVLARDTCGGPTLTYQGQHVDLTPPWRRLSYVDAILSLTTFDRRVLEDRAAAEAAATQLGLPVPPGATLTGIVNAIFEHAVEPHLTQPTFITEYPADLSPLSRRSDSDPRLTDRFELFIAGRELANGFSELNDPIDQRQRFEAQATQRAAGDVDAHALDEDFLRALEYGMPPTAGEGIGIDRLVMLLTDQASIRDVILFPQLRPETPS